MRKFIIIVGIAAAAVFIFIRVNRSADDSPQPIPKVGDEDSRPQIEIIAQDLSIPWDVELLPRGEILITERPGNLLIIGRDKKVIKVEGVRHVGEGGLLGLALHPEFEKNHWVYLYLTSQAGDKILNRVERYALSGNELFDKKIIVDGIAGSSVHDGGQLEFGPPTPNGSGQADYYLFVATGDAGDPDLAQDKNSLNGKILRVHDDGAIPADNPFASTGSARAAAVYSYGHRNPQGLAWDEQGKLWATEHGPSGVETGNDELNLIEKGKNYGWPVIRGQEIREGMENPVIESGRRETWAPAGLAFFNGRLFFAGLRGQSLYAYNPDLAELKKYFVGTYGRLRAVKAGSGGLYITTSNRDGRGSPRDGDDKLIFVRAASLR